MRSKISTLLLVAALGGCASGNDARYMPVQLLSAPVELQQVTEVMPINQLLRPQDVLDVIFHLATSSEDAYNIQPGDHVEFLFLTASELSGTRVVMPDGTVDMPYAGSIRIGGLTVAEAQVRSTEAYSRILHKPDIVLSVPQPMAQLENLRRTLTHPGTGLSRDITVGADGRASFPLLGTLSLQGLTVDELKTQLNERYASQHDGISVDVLLKHTAANEVYVLGAVTQPGAYPVRRAVSVLEVLTMAQGPLPGASLDSVVIMRRNGSQVEARLYDVDAALKGKADMFAFLQPDDLLYVPKTRLTRAGEISRQLADVVMFNGVGFSFSYRVDDKDNEIKSGR